MAETDDLSGILSAILGGSDSDDGESGSRADIDPELLLKILGIMSKLSSEDMNTELLRALRPFLREENRAKLDRAAGIMKLISLLPLLRESGLF